MSEVVELNAVDHPSYLVRRSGVAVRNESLQADHAARLILGVDGGEGALCDRGERCVRYGLRAPRSAQFWRQSCSRARSCTKPYSDSDGRNTSRLKT